MADKVTVDLTTGIGTLSFPRVFESTKGKNDKGEDSYDLQILIPKKQKADIRALLEAIQKVGESQWGSNWRKVKNPLRDGDKEADDLTEDGKTTKGEKYPERAGCYFMNVRSKRAPGVYAPDRSLITDPGALYGGCKVKVALTFYAYNSNGNQGVGASLNGVQKIADGEPFGATAPPVESMFDVEDETDYEIGDDLDGVADEKPKKKGKSKKAEPEPEPVKSKKKSKK